MIRIVGISFLFALLAITPSSADLTTTFTGRSGPPIIPPPVPCGAGSMTGQLDFSNPCNLIYYHQVMI